jgi:hypothetical protein
VIWLARYAINPAEPVYRFLQQACQAAGGQLSSSEARLADYSNLNNMLIYNEYIINP